MMAMMTKMSQSFDPAPITGPGVAERRNVSTVQTNIHEHSTCGELFKKISTSHSSRNLQDETSPRFVQTVEGKH